MAIAFVQSAHNSEMVSSSQGLALSFPSKVAVGDTLLSIVVGMKNPDPYQAGHTSAAEGAMDGNTPTPVVNAGTTLSFVLTAAAAPVVLTLSSVAASVGGSAVYTGTITNGGANAFAGQSFLIAGFVNGANNGTFLCSASSATTLTLANASAVLETHAATATDKDSVYTGTITGGASNAFAGLEFVIAGFGTGANNGTFACVGSTATTLILANASAANETHAGTAVSGGTAGWVSQVAFKSIDAKVATSTLNDGTQSVPTFEGDYPAVFIHSKLAADAGDTLVVKNAYAGPSVAGTQDGNGTLGRSVFDGGVNVVGLEFSGVTTVSGPVSRTTTANPAKDAAAAYGAAGNVIVCVGICKNGNVYQPQTGWTVLKNEKFIGSQQHFVVVYKVLSGTDNGQFINPLGMEMILASVLLA